MGCMAFRARTEAELERALGEARACAGPALIECHVAPVPAPSSGAWWDLGVPEVSGDELVTRAAAAQREGAALQRWFG
jgi:3D-(3,5/4)-trihydroxycyclohexane-1,2-dione acylhydrolase (decyclizing)